MLIRSAAVLAVLGLALAQDTDLGSGTKILFKLYDDCQQRGLVSCLKMKAITFFDRAARSGEFALGDVVRIVRDSNAPAQEAPVLTEKEMEETLPRAEEARDSRLNALLLNRVADFFNSHNLVMSLPKLNPNELQNGVEEGRGKMKKMMSMMMMGFAMKMAAIVPIAIGLLFLLAGKALVISKIALILTLIIALKKLLSQKQSHGHDSGWQSSGGWDRRSFIPPKGAQELAYRAHISQP